MKVGVLFNCQHQMLAEVLRLARPDLEVVNFEIGQLRQDLAWRDATAEVLAGCDHVLSLYLPPEDGPLASEAMTVTMRRLTLLPIFVFGGFHPDTVYIRSGHGFLDGFTHDYHSRIAVAGFLSGRTVRETIDLYNALVMGRAGYFDAFAHEQALICQAFEGVGVDLNPLFANWAGRGCFMHSINHPKAWCYTDVALALLQYAGLTERDAAVDASLVSDNLRFHPIHPVLPPLARRLGVAPETGFKPPHPSEDHSVPLERFVELEFERFVHAAEPELEATPGVATLRAVLG